MGVVDEVRPKWWKALVLLLEVVLPGIYTVAGWVAPLTVYLDGYEADHKKITLHIADELRGEACGTALAVVVGFFAATTQKVDVLNVCNLCLLVYVSLLVASYVLLWILDGYCDQAGLLLVTPMILVHAYMLCRIRIYRKEIGDEAVSLLV
jgi:hypothetical protein